MKKNIAVELSLPESILYPTLSRDFEEVKAYSDATRAYDKAVADDNATTTSIQTAKVTMDSARDAVAEKSLRTYAVKMEQLAQEVGKPVAYLKTVYPYYATCQISHDGGYGANIANDGAWVTLYDVIDVEASGIVRKLYQEVMKRVQVQYIQEGFATGELGENTVSGNWIRKQLLEIVSKYIDPEGEYQAVTMDVKQIEGAFLTTLKNKTNVVKLPKEDEFDRVVLRVLNRICTGGHYEFEVKKARK